MRHCIIIATVLLLGLAGAWTFRAVDGPTAETPRVTLAVEGVEAAIVLADTPEKVATLERLDAARLDARQAIAGQWAETLILLAVLAGVTLIVLAEGQRPKSPCADSRLSEKS